MLDTIPNTIESAKVAIENNDYASMCYCFKVIRNHPEANAIKELLQEQLKLEDARRFKLREEYNKYYLYTSRLKKYEDKLSFYANALRKKYGDATLDLNDPTAAYFCEKAEAIFGIRIDSLAKVEGAKTRYEVYINASVRNINKLNGVFDRELSKQNIERAGTCQKEIENEKAAILEVERQITELKENAKQKKEEYNKEINARKKDKLEFKKKLKEAGLDEADIKTYTSQGAKKRIDNKIRELEQNLKGLNEKDHKLLTVLKGAPEPKRISRPKEPDITELQDKINKSQHTINEKTAELQFILGEYDVKNIDELKTKLAPFINPEEYNNSDQIANSLETVKYKKREDILRTVSEGANVSQPSINNLPENAQKSVDSAFDYIRSQGYINAAGKKQFMRYEPVIEGKGKNAKVVEVKTVVESMDDIIKNPRQEYRKALKEFKANAKRVGIKYSGKEMLTLRCAHDPYWHEKVFARIRHVECNKGKCELDKFIKSVVAIKSAVTSTEIRAVFLDQSTIPSYAASSFIDKGGDFDYTVPHVEKKAKEGFINRLFKREENVYNYEKQNEANLAVGYANVLSFSGYTQQFVPGKEALEPNRILKRPKDRENKPKDRENDDEFEH